MARMRNGRFGSRSATASRRGIRGQSFRGAGVSNQALTPDPCLNGVTGMHEVLSTPKATTSVSVAAPPAPASAGSCDDAHHVDRRVSRPGDVPHAGRGDAAAGAAPGFSVEHLLVDRGLQHVTRAVAGMFAPRPDSAGVLVPGRRGAAVLDRKPAEQGRALQPHARTRGVAEPRVDLPRHLPAIAVEGPDLLDVRGHAHADRPRLSLAVPAGVHVAARPDHQLRDDPRRLLGRVRPVSAAGPGLQLRRRRRARRLAASLLGVPRPLQQELQSRVGVRRLVPEPVSAGEAVHRQRRRLVHAELHSNARDDDARHVGRRVAENVALDDREVEGARHRRRRARPSPACCCNGCTSSRSSSGSGRRRTRCTAAAWSS